MSILQKRKNGTRQVYIGTANTWKSKIHNKGPAENHRPAHEVRP